MEPYEADVAECLRVMRQGGVILYPTDTVWGLGCDATNAGAIEKIYHIKQRPSSKSMITLLAEERDLLHHVAAPDLELFDYLRTVQKPTTVVFDGIIGFAENLLAPDGSAGIRIVKDPFCRYLIKRFRKPIVSTSANFSGHPTPANFSAIDDGLKALADYVVRHRQQETMPAAPSAVIRWHHGNIKVLRS